jgi:3',5'-cyclic-AMP phosphodiesterase
MSLHPTLAIGLLLLLSGCDKLFDITPWDTLPDHAPRDLTEENIRWWKERSGGDETITIAITSDPHYHYGDLTDVVAHMRSDPGIDVVIVPGDLTDQGLVREFEWFTSIMSEVHRPWLAMIGNHDHLSNGRLVYERMFGRRNFFVDINGHRFIFFDDTVWESEEPPDVAWFAEVLSATGDLIPIVFAHIPLHTDQLQAGLGLQLNALMMQAGVPLFVHGHVHGFKDHHPIDGGVRHLSCPWPRARQYVRLRIQGADIGIQLVTL